MIWKLLSFSYRMKAWKKARPWMWAWRVLSSPFTKAGLTFRERMKGICCSLSEKTYWVRGIELLPRYFIGLPDWGHITAFEDFREGYLLSPTAGKWQGRALGWALSNAEAYAFPTGVCYTSCTWGLYVSLQSLEEQCQGHDHILGMELQSYRISVKCLEAALANKVICWQ